MSHSVRPKVTYLKAHIVVYPTFTHLHPQSSYEEMGMTFQLAYLESTWLLPNIPFPYLFLPISFYPSSWASFPTFLTIFSATCMPPYAPSNIFFYPHSLLIL
jgi:hypothetical protein